MCWTIGRGFSEPHHYVAALKAKLEDMGVDIRENQPLIGFELRGGRVRELQRLPVRSKQTRSSAPSSLGPTICYR